MDVLPETRRQERRCLLFRGDDSGVLSYEMLHAGVHRPSMVSQ